MAIAKVFTSGRSQAVRIPKEFRFDEDEVYINRIGNMVTLTPVKKLSEEFEEGARMLSGDFLAEDIKEYEQEERLPL